MQELINELFTLNEYQLKEVEKFINELKNPKKKRSLNCNSYCWVLLGQIADEIGKTKEEVYRDYIKEKGIYRIITMNKEAVPTFKKIWSDKGLGWLCEESETKIAGLVDIIAYYGTSSYNNKQMSIFIDYVVQEAEQLGINTITPKELESLKGEWK